MLTSRFIAAVRLQDVRKYFRGFVKASPSVSNPYKTFCADNVSPSILVNMYTSLYVLYNGTGATLITWPLRSQITPFSWSWANTFSTLVLHSTTRFLYFNFNGIDKNKSGYMVNFVTTKKATWIHSLTLKLRVFKKKIRY